MELKSGYKHTDVGVIPEDWDATSVQNASTNITVGFVGSMAHLFVRDGVPLLRGQNILPQALDLTSLKFISPATHKLWKKSALLPGDVAIVRVGYPGTACSIPEGLGDMNAASLVLVRPNKKCLDSTYLTHVLNSSLGKGQVSSLLVGGAQQVFNTRTAADFVVALPPLPEQRAIATALSDVDALLGGLDRLIAKKRDLKQAAKQQLLTGQTRLPGYSGAWEMKRLGNVADVIDPHPSHRAPDEVTNGVPFVGIGDLDEAGNIVGKKVRLVSTVVLEEHASRYDLNDELIGLGRVASIGKVVSLKNLADRYAISPTLGVIRGREAKRSYLLYALKSRFVTEQFTKIMSGSTRSSVGMEVLRELDVRLPPSEQEQDAIAAVLSDMDAELAALVARCDKTRALKQAMMQELLTGKTRLVPVEAAHA